jgi:hypothetical protein
MVGTLVAMGMLVVVGIIMYFAVKWTEPPKR